MSREPFDRLPRSSRVVRLVTLDDYFLPHGGSGLPIPEAFRPTDDDRAEAVERKKPVLVSVWEHGLTSVEEATAFRVQAATEAGRPPPEVVPFWLSVGVIEDAGTDPDRLKVLWDPRPQQDGPGACGHCGIAGLEKRAGEKRGAGKRRRKEMLDKLAEKAKHHPPG